MKSSTCKLKLNKISIFDMVTKKMMNLSFFTNFFGRSVQLSSSFGKTFSYVRDACKYKDKVYQADSYRKNKKCHKLVMNAPKGIGLA